MHASVVVHPELNYGLNCKLLYSSET